MRILRLTGMLLVWLLVLLLSRLAWRGAETKGDIGAQHLWQVHCDEGRYQPDGLQLAGLSFTGANDFCRNTLRTGAIEDELMPGGAKPLRKFEFCWRNATIQVKTLPHPLQWKWS